MLLRMSSLFLRTLREDPADAEVPSHRLLVRAGYVRRAAPGIYSWLPLGYLVYRNVERKQGLAGDRGRGRAARRAVRAEAIDLVIVKTPCRGVLRLAVAACSLSRSINTKRSR